MLVSWVVTIRLYSLFGIRRVDRSYIATHLIIHAILSLPVFLRILLFQRRDKYTLPYLLTSPRNIYLLLPSLDMLLYSESVF